MRITIRFLAVVGALMGLYLAAVLQSGPETVDANICALARRWHMAVPDQCAPWIDTLARIGVVLGIALCLGFLVWDFVSFLHRRSPRLKRASHSQLFIGIMEAIYWIAEKSAWGRWQAVQRRASGGTLSEIFKFNAAEQALRTAAENGQLLIQGREKKSVEYKDFDQHFWRTAHFEIESDPVCLWKATIKPKAGADVSISEYDDVWTEKRKVETLWRQRDWRYDWPTYRLNLRLMWERMKDPKAIPETAAPADTPSTEQPASVEIQVPVAEVRVEAHSPSVITVTPLAPDNWEQLFAIGDDGRSVWLRFLPDTKH